MAVKKLSKGMSTFLITMGAVLFAILIWVIAIVVLVNYFNYIDYASNYTVDQHISRISQRAEKRYIGDKNHEYAYTDLTVYPLYDAEDNVTHYLIEFEPSGYMFVEQTKIERRRLSMYHLMYNENYWQKFQYQLVVDEKEHERYIEQYETDESGREIKYYSSPYKLFGVEANEKLYLFPYRYDFPYNYDSQRSDYFDGYIPAVKRDDKFINVMTGEFYDPEVQYEDPIVGMELRFIPTLNNLR